MDDAFVQVSFRVYTPTELQHKPLRSSDLPSPSRLEPVEREDTSFRPATLAKYMAAGFGATVLLFAGFIAVANLTDDTLVTGARSEDYEGVSKAVAAPAPKMPKYDPTSAAGTRPWSPTVAAPAADFELPDDATPVQRTATKGPRPKQGKRSIRAAQ